MDSVMVGAQSTDVRSLMASNFISRVHGCQGKEVPCAGIERRATLRFLRSQMLTVRTSGGLRRWDAGGILIPVWRLNWRLNWTD